jgi:hypothetical protein
MTALPGGRDPRPATLVRGPVVRPDTSEEVLPDRQLAWPAPNKSHHAYHWEVLYDHSCARQTKEILSHQFEPVATVPKQAQRTHNRGNNDHDRTETVHVCNFMLMCDVNLYAVVGMVPLLVSSAHAHHSLSPTAK